MHWLISVLFSDCYKAIRKGSGKEGIYLMQPRDAPQSFVAYCDAEGWTVIERRLDGNISFYRWGDKQNTQIFHSNIFLTNGLMFPLTYKCFRNMIVCCILLETFWQENETCKFVAFKLI